MSERPAKGSRSPSTAKWRSTGSAPTPIRLCRYLELDALGTLFASDTDIAAVILDPAMHAGGLGGSDVECLGILRELTERYGIRLIFDEVISGCRLAPGGAQQYFGIKPDLVTMATG